MLQYTIFEIRKGSNSVNYKATKQHTSCGVDKCYTRDNQFISSDLHPSK